MIKFKDSSIKQVLLSWNLPLDLIVYLGIFGVKNKKFIEKIISKQRFYQTPEIYIWIISNQI